MAFLSGGYKAKVLAQPPSEELKHAEWDWVNTR
jgi:hypothetical protein